MANYKILVLDKKENTNNIIVNSIKDFNNSLRISIGTSMEDSLAFATTEIPDVVILEVERVALDGVEFLRRLKINPLTKHIQIIICAPNIPETKNLQPFVSSGQAEFVRTPIDKLELEAQINSVLKCRDNYLKHKQVEERLKETQRIAHLGTWELNVADQKLYWSDETWNISGYKPIAEEPTTEKYYDSIHPDDRDLFNKSIEEAIKGKPYEIELRHLRPDGTYNHVLTHCKPVYKDGEVVELFGSVLDITHRKKMEEILRKSEKKYRTVVENASEGMFVIQEGYIVFCNQALHDLFGYNMEELTSGHFINLLHDDDKDKVLANHENRLKGKKIPTYSAKVKKKDGNYLIVEINAAQFEYNNKPATLNLITDITARLKTENELKENEERYRLIFSNSIEAISIFSATSLKFIDANDAFFKMYGYSREELLHMSVKDISAEVEVTEKAIKNSAKEGSVNIPLRYHKKKDGTIIIVSIAAGPFTWKGEKVMYSIIRDVTEKIKLEQEVISSRELLQNMADSMPAFVGVADAETIRYKFVNQKFVDAYNMERSKIIGSYFGDILGAENAEFAMKYINKVRAGNQSSYINEFELAGGKKYVNVNFTPFFDNLGEVKDIIILSHDITEQKVAEQELQRAKEKLEEQNTELKELNATKNKFFSIIAHDLKSPFNALLGIGEMLKNNLKNNDVEGAQGMAEVMFQSALKSFKLLENLLEWATIQTNKMKYTPENVSVKSMAEQVVQLYRAKALKKEIKLYSKINRDCEVLADANMIHTVIRNLVNNAIKFTRKNGEVSIECKENQAKVEISVVDTGVGMKKPRLENLFLIDKCYSTNGTENEKGSGLGLILCKEFIEINKGAIFVKSEYNKGSKFTVLLPKG